LLIFEFWAKVKCLNREEFVVVGWTDPEGARPWLPICPCSPFLGEFGERALVERKRLVTRRPAPRSRDRHPLVKKHPTEPD